jgi:hypothetical protein
MRLGTREDLQLKKNKTIENNEVGYKRGFATKEKQNYRKQLG